MTKAYSMSSSHARFGVRFATKPLSPSPGAKSSSPPDSQAWEYYRPELSCRAVKKWTLRENPPPAPARLDRLPKSYTSLISQPARNAGLTNAFAALLFVNSIFAASHSSLPSKRTEMAPSTTHSVNGPE